LNLKQYSKPSDFYQFAIHLIYAIIIAQSFEIAKEILIPINGVFSSFSNIVDAAGLFFVYFIIVSGWVGYARSISRVPHKDNLLGTTRFTLDLTILFIFFYLLNIVNNDGFLAQFNWMIVGLFIIYAIWDQVKYKEYKNKKKEKKHRSGQTLWFLLFFFILALVYQEVVLDSELIFASQDAEEFIFILILFGLTFAYRFWKWKPAKRISRNKPNTNKK